MSLRRAGIAAAVLLLAIVVATSVAARVNEDERAVAPPRAAVEPAREVDGELPADGTVRARVGDIVAIAVSSPVDEDAEIAELGEHADVSPQAPGMLEFVAFRPGRFAVTLRYSGERVGTLVVEPGPAA